MARITWWPRRHKEAAHLYKEVSANIRLETFMDGTALPWPAYVQELGGRHIPLMPQLNNPKLFNGIVEYIHMLETGMTHSWCNCVWRVHPADTAIAPDYQRRQRVEQHPLCRTHTREGFLVGYLHHVTKAEE